MESMFEQAQRLFFLIFVHPKSTTSLLVLLLLVVAIALYVNRRRDETGRVSFVDRSKTGVVCLRIYRTEDGYRKESWLLPLWSPEKRLLLNVKILLPKGLYDVKACWRAQCGAVSGKNLFASQPIEKERIQSISDVGRFSVRSNDAALEFKMAASGKNIWIESPDEKLVEPDPSKPPFPLSISDMSLKRAENDTAGNCRWRTSAFPRGFATTPRGFEENSTRLR